MDTNKLFETAIRSKYRYNYRGVITTEDLWDLSKEDLDTIFKSLNAQVRRNNEDSLLSRKTKADEVLENEIEIVKYIVSVKIDEEAVRRDAAQKREKRAKLMEALSAKENEELHSKSSEEIKKMIEELDN